MNIPNQIISHLPPHLIVSPLSGKKYIVPHWIEVPNETTLDEVQSRWVRPESKIPKASSELQEFEVKSTDGERTYKITFQNNLWTCTCKKFPFKKSCRHINHIKLGKQ